MTTVDVIDHSAFGHNTAFEFKQEVSGDRITLTVTTVLPQLELKDGVLLSYAPPEYPWKFLKGANETDSAVSEVQ